MSRFVGAFIMLAFGMYALILGCRPARTFHMHPFGTLPGWVARIFGIFIGAASVIAFILTLYDVLRG